MAIVNFKYGTKAKIDETPIQNGTLYICLDNNYIYADIEDERKILGGIAALGDAAYKAVEEKIEIETAEENVASIGAIKDYVLAQGIAPETVYSTTEPEDGYAKIWIET